MTCLNYAEVPTLLSAEVIVIVMNAVHFMHAEASLHYAQLPGKVAKPSVQAACVAGGPSKGAHVLLR